MKISYFDTYQSMSVHAAESVLTELKQKLNALICCATGGSPQGLYEELVNAYQRDPSYFKQLRILKLDEWGGIPMSDANSCQSYLRKYVLEPLKISTDRFVEFNSEANDVEEECKRVQAIIHHDGPIDVCILGLGKNGHLGFNEPADFLQMNCHRAELTATTLQHAMVSSMNLQPTFGMTVGFKDIFNSRKIILLITGSQKQETIKKLMNGKISTQLPASLLWLHTNVECLVDKTSL